MYGLDWELLGGVEKSGFLREGRAGARGGKECKQKGAEVTLAPAEADGTAPCSLIQLGGGTCLVTMWRGALAFRFLEANLLQGHSSGGGKSAG